MSDFQCTLASMQHFLHLFVGLGSSQLVIGKVLHSCMPEQVCFKLAGTIHKMAHEIRARNQNGERSRCKGNFFFLQDGGCLTACLQGLQ